MKNILFISLLVSFVGCTKMELLLNLKPAIKNTAIGSTAMEENTTGSFNTGFACDCYPELQKASNSIQIGWLSGDTTKN